MSTDSLEKRYLTKLSANLTGLIIGLVSQAMIARGLGPKLYGDFGYLTNFFNRIINFFDMGTSIGFYTKLSQRQNDFGLVSFYISYAGLASIFVIVLTGLFHKTELYLTLLPDQIPFFIYLAVLFGILTWVAKIFDKMADAYGLTVPKEIAVILQKGLGLVVILILFISNQLNLTNFFFYHYFVLILLTIIIIIILGRNNHSLWRNWKLSRPEIKSYTREFYNYNYPLFIYGLVGLIVGILDRWLLQTFSGSIEQGYFWLSHKIAVVCFICTGAMTQLITREFAIAFDKKDIPEMARLFRRYIPMLYSIAAYFSCFIAVEAKKVALLMGGEKFQNAALAIMIMSLFPIHQTYGQLSGSVFYATGQTKLYRNIGVANMTAGIILAYFLLAPRTSMGLNAGSLGLAIKTVIMNIIGVNIQLYFNARFLNLSLWRYQAHQVISVGCLIGCALTAQLSVNKVFFLPNKTLLSFLLSGILYTILVLVLILAQPLVFGVKRQEIHSLIRLITKKLKQFSAPKK